MPLRVSTSGTASGTTWSIARDAAVQDGDYVVIHCVTNTASTLSAVPDGFTSTSITGSTHDSHVIRGFATSSHTNFNVTFDASESGAWGCRAYSGIDATTPEDVAIVAQTGGFDTVHAVTVDPVTEGCDILSGIGYDAGSAGTTAWTTDSGGTITERYDLEGTGNTGATGADETIASGHAAVTHTATLSGTGSQTTTKWILALRPAPAGGGNVEESGTLVIGASGQGTATILGAKTASFGVIGSGIAQTTASGQVTLAATATGDGAASAAGPFVVALVSAGEAGAGATGSVLWIATQTGVGDHTAALELVLSLVHAGQAGMASAGPLSAALVWDGEAGGEGEPVIAESGTLVASVLFSGGGSALYQTVGTLFVELAGAGSAGLAASGLAPLSLVGSGAPRLPASGELVVRTVWSRVGAMPPVPGATPGRIVRATPGEVSVSTAGLSRRGRTGQLVSGRTRS